MAKGTITGTITRTVILGSAAYPSVLDIATTGDIAPTVGGSAGIFDPRRIEGARIDNQGQVHGAAGAAAGGNGGIAVDLLAAASVTNSGTITGGAGIYNYSNQSTLLVHGGIGVDLSAGGSVSNTGLITGGEGSAMKFKGGAGGAGVVLNGGVLTNQGGIGGGWVGYSGFGFGNPEKPGENGGDGADLVNGSIGTNSGTITGGYGQIYADLGGTGVQLAHSAFTNSGDIVGGRGGSNLNRMPDEGGIGVNLAEGSIVNDSGNVSGGYGGFSLGGGGGPGGAGLVVSNSLLIESGTVTGGSGGGGDSPPDFQGEGGVGGDGVTLNGGLVELTGTIQGGTTGMSLGSVVAPGVGINGGKLVDNGTILGGRLTKTAAPSGDAIAFGTKAGTLVLGTRAVLDGNVVGTAGAGDALVLAAGGAGTLAGLGTAVAGFDTITVAAHANWTLSGATTLTATENLRDNAALTLGGALSGTGSITLDAGSTLIATAGVTGAAIAFNGAATLVLDSLSAFSSTLSGFSTGDTIDLAKIHVTSDSYKNGTLTLIDGSSVAGSLAFAGSFTQADFHLGPDGHGGTDITFAAAAQNTGPDEHVRALHLPDTVPGLWQSFLHDVLK